MPIPRRNITVAELDILERRHDGPIPKEMLGPFYDLPKTKEGLDALLVELAHEAHETRQKPFHDAPLASIHHEMEIVREALAKLEAS